MVDRLGFVHTVHNLGHDAKGLVHCACDAPRAPGGLAAFALVCKLLAAYFYFDMHGVSDESHH